MTDKELLVRGYVRYPPYGETSECITDVFQKAFGEDGFGTKYFITVMKWDYSCYKEDILPQYETRIYLTLKENNSYICINYLSEWKIEDIEKHIEDLFSTGIYKRYSEEY